MTELDKANENDVIEAHIATYSFNTRKAYESAFRKLKNILGGDIRDTSEDEIIKKVKGEVENKNSMNALINIAIKVKRIFDQNHDILVEYRDHTLRGAIHKSTIAKNTRLSPLLPTYNEVDTWIDGLYTSGDYRQYVINFLIWNLNTRNLDLWARFIRNTKEATGEHNYLVLTAHKVEYIRRRYKTAGTYGEKFNVITNSKFVKACWELTKGFYRDPETHPYWLVLKSGPGSEGEPSTEEQIGHYVSSQTFDKIGESNYLKIIMAHIDATGNISRLNHISRNRGTHTNVLLTNYNIKNKLFIEP